MVEWVYLEGWNEETQDFNNVNKPIVVDGEQDDENA